MMGAGAPFISSKDLVLFRPSCLRDPQGSLFLVLFIVVLVLTAK
jgi:hypothetical protein